MDLLNDMVLLIWNFVCDLSMLQVCCFLQYTHHDRPGWCFVQFLLCFDIDRQISFEKDYNLVSEISVKVNFGKFWILENIVQLSIFIYFILILLCKSSNVYTSA